MHKQKFRIAAVCGAIAIACGVGIESSNQSTAASDDPLVEGFRKVAIASVSDAVDQVTGERGFLNHDMGRVKPGSVKTRLASGNRRKLAVALHLPQL